jgi:hypothetical protein
LIGFRDADGLTVLNFAEAKERARAWFASKAREQIKDAVFGLFHEKGIVRAASAASAD